MKKKSPSVYLTNNDSENLHGGSQEWNQDRTANETRLNWRPRPCGGLPSSSSHTDFRNR